ncbi:MAG: TonB-dependent receptor [Pseudomonadota bacterium]
MAQSQDEIIVTGSFIKKKNQSDLPSPLQTVTAANIDSIGAQNIGDITQTLTINTGAQNNPDAFTQNATAGTSNINLRGLGVGSTLVLLNGKRQVLSGASTNDGVNFVDTSSLVPMIAIQRVEILKDGASAIYGSDAVAGVVNFITRESFDGVLLSGTYTSHQSEGDYDEFNIEGLYGKDFDRGSIMLAASYLDRSPLTTSERRLSRPQDDSSILGNPGAFFGAPGLPAGAPAIDPGCADGGGIPTAASPADPTAAVVGFCSFDFGDFFNLVPDEQRLNIFARSEFDVTDSINWSMEFGYADNEATRGNSPTFPFLQLGAATIPGPEVAGLGADGNPFNLFPNSVVFLGRAIGNGGEVSPSDGESETWRFSTTIGGDIGTGAWEFSFTRASNDYSFATEDTVTDRYGCALQGFQSLFGLDCSSANPDLTTGGLTVPAVGTFINPFSTSLTGVAPNDPALLDYIIGVQVREYESDLTVVEAVVSQELFQMPAGPFSVAVGAQYRDNDLSQEVDELSAADAFAFLVGGRDFDGSQDVYAFFGEASIPVTSWMDLQVAVRHESYGDDEGGSTTDPKVAVLMRPHETLSLRGSYSTSFRAPSVFQQFGESTTLQQVFDPANNNAQAFVAVRTLAPEGSARPLDPEESEAFNVGATWSPVPGLSLDIDYFNFSFENVIIQTNPQALLNADPTGDAIVRSPANTVLQINNDFVNASSVDTSGIDFNAAWDIDVGEWGTITPSLNGTYILEYDLEDPQAGSVEGAGTRNFTNFGSPTPELRLNAGVAWNKGPHTFNAFVRHIGSYDDDQNVGVEVDSDTRIDLQYTVALNEFLDREQVTRFTIGGRNITGETAPQVFTNGGFDSRVHDPRGALLYFGVDLEF